MTFYIKPKQKKTLPVTLRLNKLKMQRPLHENSVYLVLTQAG